MPNPLHRRTLLRGLGASLALPWLEAMAPRARAATVAGKPPQRFAFIYTPNGYNQQSFVPKVTGAGWELTPALEPLADLRKELTLCTGLDRQFVGGTGVHAQCGACWLTSSPPSETLDGGFPTNITLDQIIARTIGGDTVLPSLELSCNDFTDNKETRYYECISWAGPGYAAGVEKNPRAVFQRLFGSGGRPSRGVLDTVLEDAKALQAKLGREDREKLGEYLESVHATEHRIELAEKAAKRLKQPPIPEPAGIPELRGDYLRLMGDLIVLAFQNDLARVASLVVDPERWDSPRMFHGLFDKPQNHHVLTHTKGEEAKAAITKIDRFHVELYAYVVGRLREIREGEGTLLDSCCVVMGSGLSDGDTHKYSDLEVLVAGRAGGVLQPGSHHHFAGEVPLANLWLTLAQAAGVKRERFADSTGKINKILA
ncbi:DUF1552 domain-containing protein [Haloferula sp. BvORR071]|uniref:DUF1552 domain-containing protein n=1 Tax=Haloferula sp. BvORR071 TaxID=1396141 RepID=UPI000552D7AB|nr:DUF1552 domain-containing protein [Haloferula sp. BvORR071]